MIDSYVQLLSHLRSPNIWGTVKNWAFGLRWNSPWRSQWLQNHIYWEQFWLNPPSTRTYYMDPPKEEIRAMQSGLRYKLLSKYPKAKAHETLYIEEKTTIENSVLRQCRRRRCLITTKENERCYLALPKDSHPLILDYGHFKHFRIRLIWEKDRYWWCVVGWQPNKQGG